MVQNKQSFSTFSASPSPSFSLSAASSMMPLATPPPRSDIPAADQHPPPPSTTFNSIFGVPASSYRRPHSSSSTSSMGQVVSRPEVNAALLPSSAPPSLGVSASNTGSLFKRAFVGRRKKSDIVTSSSPRLDNGKETQIDESSHGSMATAPRQPGAKQLTLQLAQHVFNKKSAPASPAMSGLGLPPPPPPPPPKYAQQTTCPLSHLMPIDTNVDKRISTITTSSPIVPALDYMRKSDEHAEQIASKENERKDFEGSEPKDVRRKSDSTLSLHTIRPTLGSKTPRPVSLAESLHSTHTIVPVNKRLSALITDTEYVMAEEADGESNDEKGRGFNHASSASSLRLRDRRSQSLNLGPPLSLMVSSPTTSNTTMNLGAITVTLPRSASETCERERLVTRETTTTTVTSLPSEATRDIETRHVSVTSLLNQASNLGTPRVERTLPALPDPSPRTTSLSPAHSPHPSFRQTAISMTSGFAPAAGLARRAVEKMGRVWGSKAPLPSPLSSPLGESFNSRTGPRITPSHSESIHHGYSWKARHNPQTPSISSTTSSLSDHEGPQLGKCFRGPVRVLPSGSVVGGLVFGRELKACVEETAIDSVLRVLHTEDVVYGGQEEPESPPLENRCVPALVIRCAQHILEWGVQEQGLFRVSGRSSHVAKLRAEFDTGADFDIVQSNPGDLDPHAVASVFKAYLRELPEHILTNQLMPYFDAAMASERLTNNIQDSPPLNSIQELRKPPSLSTLGMPNFGGVHPPSESLCKTLLSLISRLPQENRDLLLTVTELINHTAKRSSETKMPLSNLLLVLCPSLSMNPSLLQALCESQGIWSGVHQHMEAPDVIEGKTIQSSAGFSEVGTENKDAMVPDLVASHPRPSSESKRSARPLPSLPIVDGPASTPSSSPTREPSGVRVGGCNGTSHITLDTETSPSSFSTTDDDSSISHSSQSGRPVTPTSLNFKLTNPYSPPSLSCSTDSLSVASLPSGSPIQMIKSLSLVDECSEQQSSNSPHSPDISEPLPLPIPSLRPTQTPSIAQFQFPGPRDIVTRVPLTHRKSTPSISFSSSISAEARAASIASRARRLKKPSLHLLFSKHSQSPISSPISQSPAVASPLAKLRDSALRASSTPESSPDSMVTAPQSSRFSYPPVLNTTIDESSISLALGIEDEGEDHTTSVGRATENGVGDLQGSIGPGKPLPPGPSGETGRDVHTQFCQLDVALPEEERFGEYDWTQSVLMAAGESRW